LHNELAAIAEKLTMPYSSFTLAKVKKEFGLTTVEAGRFLPPIEPIALSQRQSVKRRNALAPQLHHHRDCKKALEL
jgi:hypothetical protein